GARALRAALGPESIALVPFPAFMDSGLTDYLGRSPAESLDAVRRLTGLPLPLTALPQTFTAGGGPFLGREFWAALIRGGYQGGCYYIDALFGGEGP
ncbi:MAG: hypothetical protein LBQ44_06895, partial [Treponema sp.]|nr:hypothetical protein [Treponema sp.]